MTTRRTEVERFSVISSKPFECGPREAQGGRGPSGYGGICQGDQSVRTFVDLEDTVSKGTREDWTDDVSAVGSWRNSAQGDGARYAEDVRFVIGNPLIIKEMAKHAPDAGSYAPVTILVDERPDGMHLTYDKMASLLAPYGNVEAVARDLDSKIETLLRECA